jgi:hypothetical protein
MIRTTGLTLLVSLVIAAVRGTVAWRGMARGRPLRSDAAS